MRFSVLIVTRCRPESLQNTLESLASCDPQPFELIVVDGDEHRSAEPAIERLRASTDVPAVLYSVSSPGLSVQRNRGVELASGDVVVFLDDDVEPTRDLFGILASAYEDPSVIGATGKVVEREDRRFGQRAASIRRILFPGGPDGSMTSFGYPRRMVDTERERDVEWMQGCFMSARADLLQRVSHDEQIAGHLEGEDEDFSYRLSREGRIVYLPKAVLHHKQLGFRSSRAQEREFNRNIVIVRAYLFRKNFRRTVATRVQFALLIGVLAAHRVLNREWAGAKGLLDGAAYVWRNRHDDLLEPRDAASL